MTVDLLVRFVRPKTRVVNIAIGLLKVLQYYWQYFFEYCLHIADTFRDLVLLPVLQFFILFIFFSFIHYIHVLHDIVLICTNMCQFDR